MGLIETQYSNLIEENGEDIFKDGFYVPENVYIIGTMNDIDRSVESMDFVIRRRFLWKKIQPKDQVAMLYTFEGNKRVLNEETAKTAEKVMNALNTEISDSPELGEDYQIGAEYFLKLGNLEENFEQLWEMNLEPLLREYLRGRTKNDIDQIITKFKKVYDRAVKSDGNTDQATDQKANDQIESAEGQDQEEQS